MNAKNVNLVNLVLCGPNDVAKEIDIAKGCITNWNILHSDTRGFYVRYSHWQENIFPDIAERAQEVPNRQIIDPAKILVAIFWHRFGTPTGLADSGTQEEILRAHDQRKKVMVYFSDLEPIPHDADQRQLEMLLQFRRNLRQRGICWSFKSRSEFQKMFERDLINVLNSFEPSPSAPKQKKTKVQISQTAKTGKGNIYQTIDNSKTYNHPPVEKIIRERRPDSVTAQEERQLTEWINDLADGEVRIDRKRAYAKWGGIFKTHFGLNHRGDLLSSQMPDAKAWYDLHKILQRNGYKTTAPDAFQIAKFTAIKTAMNQMGVVKEVYYSELSYRLKLRKPFSSLKQLTIKNLERVYRMVRADLKKWENTGSWQSE